MARLAPYDIKGLLVVISDAFVEEPRIGKNHPQMLTQTLTYNNVGGWQSLHMDIGWLVRTYATEKVTWLEVLLRTGCSKQQVFDRFHKQYGE